MVFESQRVFKLWDYSVSHRQMLVRSPRSPDLATNHDIVFWQVQYIDIPTQLVGLVLDTASAEDVANIQDRLGKSAPECVAISIVSQGKRYCVLAGGFKVLENTLDIFDSSLVDFGKDRLREEYGTELAHS